MYLNELHIKNYRSISEIQLLPFGNFNVLIGKNNSGKSNVLSALDVFFSCISPEIVTAKPTIGDEIDFFQKKTSNPISIAAVFALNKGERAKLLAEIGDERPQLRNVLESMESDLSVSIVIEINRVPRRFAFVRDVCLFETGTQEREQAKPLLEVSREAARAMFDAVTGLDRAKGNQLSLERLLTRLDRDDFQSLRRPERGGPPLEYFFRREVVNPQVMNQVSRIVEAATSYEDFREKLQSLITDEQSKIVGLAETPLPLNVKTFSGDENIIPQYVKNLMTRVSQIKVLHFRERRRPIGPEEAQRLLALKVKRGGSETLRGIQSTINGLLGVKVDAFEAQSSTGQSSAELDVDDFLIEVNGSGIREALRIVLDTEFAKPEIVLVEEPEIHLHPALETSIMRYLKDASTRGQIFITTHSTNFLDTGNFENVFLVSKNDSTRVSALSLADAEAKLPQELGIRLSSLFMYDQIVFVEGPSDEQVLREFANTMNINLGQLNVGFISMRGVRNIAHYAAAAVISFLTRRRVRLWFLVDRDEYNDFHFQKLKSELGETAKIHVLSKREIENYLLVPSAVAAHLVARKRAAREFSFVAPDESTVRSELEACAQSLKSLALWKRILPNTCRPIMPRNVRGQEPKDEAEIKASAQSILAQMRSDLDRAEKTLDNVCAEAQTEVDQTWSENKLKVAPGSDILDQWYRRYGFRYDKSRDGPGIASLVKQEEIDTEIRDFLRGLTSSSTN